MLTQASVSCYACFMKNEFLSPSAQDAVFTALSTVGFSNNEIRIYLGLLQIGQGTASKIARSAGVNRTTVYDVLAGLETKGLVIQLGKKPKQEYRAESPKKLESFYREKTKRDERYLDIVRDLVPQLSSIHAVGDRPVVRFYEGEEGLKHVYEDTLSSKETIRAFASVENMHAGLPNYFPKYYKRRAQAGIGIRAILPHTPEATERSQLDKAEKRESLHVDSRKYSFSPEINIYDNKIMIASWKEKLGVIIESREISDALKKIFELSWLEAEREDEKIRKK